MVKYVDTAEGIDSSHLGGFFVGWPNPPSADAHLRILKGSDLVVLAMKPDGSSVVGFITAISDGVLAAYISLLEVLPEYQGKGIGTELMQRMLGKLEHLYMADLLCAPKLEGFYQRFGMKTVCGMCRRNFDRQAAD